MDWPARSPDINPIEHAWDLLQAAVSARPVQTASLQELGTALMEEWAAVPQRRLTSIIESMRTWHCTTEGSYGDIALDVRNGKQWASRHSWSRSSRWHGASSSFRYAGINVLVTFCMWLVRCCRPVAIVLYW